MAHASVGEVSSTDVFGVLQTSPVCVMEFGAMFARSEDRNDNV
jgi:hypothetical protein